MTRTWICILASAAALWAAEKPAAPKSGTAARSAAPAQPAKKTAPAELTLPSGAVETNTATWHYTGTDGRKWIYRKTPFGLVRFEDKDGLTDATKAREKEVASIKAVEDGDSVRFERPGPFGTYKWTRKKADLDGVEREALERSRSAAAPAGQAQR